MKYHKSSLSKDEFSPSISRRKMPNNDDTLSFLKMIFPQQDIDVLKHIQEEYGNSLEKVINENLDIMDDDKNCGSLDNPLETPKTKRKKSKKIQNIPLNEWYKQYNEPRRSTEDLRVKSCLKWNDIIPNIEWLVDIFNIPKKQAASIYHQSSVSLSKSVYTLLSSDYIVQRINESLAMLQHDYKNNLKQLKKQFPSLEEHMYSRILLSVENNLAKAISVVKTIQQNPIYTEDQDQTPRFNTSPERYNHHNHDYKSEPDHTSDDMIYTNYNLEECKANLSTFIFNRNHAFNEAAKAYRKAKTQSLYRDIVTHYSEKAQEYNSKVKLWNMRAKMCMIQDSLPSYFIDLHGLTIAEAIPLVKKAVAQWWCHEQKLETDIPTPLEIITGTGLHSKNKKPKIKPSICQLLNKEGWLIEEKPGKIIVQSFRTNDSPTKPSPR